MKSAGKARSNGLYRHIRTSKEIIRNLLNYCSNNNKLRFGELFRQVIIKVWSTFSKVVGVGKAHKYFPFMQSNDSQTGESLCESNKRK